MFHTGMIVCPAWADGKPKLVDSTFSPIFGVKHTPTVDGPEKSEKRGSFASNYAVMGMALRRIR